MGIAKAIERKILVAGRPECTPRIELDLSVALRAIRTATDPVAFDDRSGTIVDVGFPVLAPLLPHLRATGTWAWVRDTPGVARARRCTRREGVVVLDGRDRSEPSRRTCRPDLVVLGTDQVTNDAHRGVGVLVDLTDARAWRIGSSLLAPRARVAGFHVDLARLSADGVADRVDLVTHLMRQYRAAGRTDRPLLVLRGARTALLARHVVGSVLRVCRAAVLPVPVMRMDVTRAVLDVAVLTVIGVLAVEPAAGGPILDVDLLPRSVALPLHVIGKCPATASIDHVLLRRRGRYVSARLLGGLPLDPGTELVAPGWTDVDRLPGVRRCSAVR